MRKIWEAGRNELRTTVAGFVKLEVSDAETGQFKRGTDWFPNLITDQGLNIIGTSSYMNWCQVGTGSATPTNTDTSLQTPIASTGTVRAESEGANNTTPYYGWRRKTWRFGAGTAVGNLTEVAIAWSNAFNTAFSRTLIKDGFGVPTSIPVLAGEVLDVFYELRLYPPLVDGSYSISISSVSYTFTTRAAQVTNGGAWGPKNAAANIYAPGGSIQGFATSLGLGTITDTGPGGTYGFATGGGAEAYSNNSLQRDLQWFWDLDQGNVDVTGIKGFLFHTTLGRFQAEVTPRIPKDATKTLLMRTRLTWARH